MSSREKAPPITDGKSDVSNTAGKADVSSREKEPPTLMVNPMCAATLMVILMRAATLMVSLMRAARRRNPHH